MSQPHAGLDRESPTSTRPRTPRWVKVFGIVIAVVVLLFVIMLFAVGGEHGPGRHLPGGADGSRSLIAHGVHQV